MNRTGLIATLVIGIVMMLAFGYAHAQDPVIWDRHYGSSNSEVASRFLSTDDGGYLIAGETDHFEQVARDIYLIKINANGEEEWSHYYGNPENDACGDLVVTSDGGYLIVGSTWIQGANLAIWLIKIDQNGDVEWDNHYAGEGHEHGIRGFQMDDGGFAVLGYSYEPFGACLLRTDESGNQTDYSVVIDNVALFDAYWNGNSFITLCAQGVWSTPQLNCFGLDGDLEWTVDLAQGEEGICGTDFTLTSDGGYAVALHKRHTDALYYPMIVKIDENGGLEWSHLYEYDVPRLAQLMVDEVENNNLLVTGCDGAFYLLKAAEDGDLIWTSTQDDNDEFRQPDFGAELRIGANGTYEFLATTWLGRAGTITEGLDIAVSHFNQDGEFQSWQLYGFPGGSTETGNGIIHTSDGGYLIGGGTFVTNDMLADLLILRLDEEGDSLWSKTYDVGESLGDVHIIGMDDGAVLGGVVFSDEGRRSFWLMKIDGGGEQLWFHDYEHREAAWCGDLIKCRNGDYLIVGGFASGAALLASSEGEQLASASLGGCLASAIEREEGGFAFLAWQSCQVLVTDEDLQEQERYDAGVADEEPYGRSLIRTENDGFLVVGTLSNEDDRSFITRLDAEGEVVDQWIYEANRLKNSYAIFLLPDEQILLGNQWGVVRINDNGRIVAQTAVPHGEYLSPNAYNWELLEDGIMLATGIWPQYDYAPSDIWAIKINVDSLNEALPEVSCSPEALDFGVVAVGEEHHQGVTITNEGGENLILNSPYIQPQDSPFQIVFGGWREATVEPGNSILCNISFYTEREGRYLDTLYLTTNDLNSPYVQIPLYADARQLGIPKPELPMNFTLKRIFPNPFNTDAVAEIGMPRRGVVELSVFDLNGRLVIRRRVSIPVGWQRIGLGLNDVSAGEYIVKIDSDENVFLRKIVCVK